LAERIIQFAADFAAGVKAGKGSREERAKADGFRRHLSGNEARFPSSDRPAQGGAVALTTNDYLMVGTQLGWTGLVCFVAYVTLSLGRWSKIEGRESGKVTSLVTRNLSLQTACRASALALAVAFWFDGGLFKLATASVFWILLELGAVKLPQKVTSSAKSEPAPFL